MKLPCSPTASPDRRAPPVRRIPAQAFLPLVALALLVLVGSARASARVDTDRYRESLRPRGMVSDFAGVLRPAQNQALERLLEELKTKTGVELAVVAVPSLHGGEIDDFANRLFEQWGIGDKDRDDGVLLLAAIEDRRVRIEVGYGLEAVMTDAAAGRILDLDVLPKFKLGAYGGGLADGARSIAARVALAHQVTLDGLPQAVGPGAPGGSPLLTLLMLLLLLPVLWRHPWILLLFLGRGGGFPGGGGGFGGGFGGFGGGLSGGGGASRGW